MQNSCRRSLCQLTPIPVDIKLERTARCNVHMQSGGAEGDEIFVSLDLLRGARFAVDIPFLLRIEGSGPVSSELLIDLVTGRLCPKRISVVMDLLRKSGVSGIWCSNPALLYQKVRLGGPCLHTHPVPVSKLAVANSQN